MRSTSRSTHLPAGSALAPLRRSQYGRWIEAERKLKETPALLKMPSGYVQQNPWLTIATKQLELMHRYMSELGLSPVARSRVDVRRPAQPSKFDGLLGVKKPWE